MRDECEQLGMALHLAEGILGLHTKPGRGRKPVLDISLDSEVVRTAVSNNRQCLDLIKAEVVAATGKPVGKAALRCFLKNLVGTINV